MNASRSSAAAAFSAPWLASRLRELIGPLKGARLCVAFSGGADSTALLAALAALTQRHGLRVRAAHVNHHLHEQAGAMAQAAMVAARALHTPCVLLDAPVRSRPGESVEAAARAVRYAALYGQLKSGEYLLLAQQREDQLETVLLQLLRGAGVAGLSAMPGRSGPLLRPLLHTSRAALRRYLRRRALGWYEDPSNTDERFDRNYLRQRVLPALSARWPAAALTVARSAALAAEAQGLLESQADAALGAAQDGTALRVSVLRRLAGPARRNALRRWLARRALPLPDQRRLQELAGPLLEARHDAQPEVRWQGACVRRHGDRLFALPLAAAAAGTGIGSPTATRSGAPGPLHWDWRARGKLALPQGAQLALQRSGHGPLALAALPPRLEVRFRTDAGLAPLSAAARVKRVLQEHGVAPWLRASVPLLCAAGRVVAIADLWCEPALRAASGTAERARLVWRAPARSI